MKTLPRCYRSISFMLLGGVAIAALACEIAEQQQDQVTAAFGHVNLQENFREQQENGRRIRRTPAVWGDPPPDYSAAQLENGETYLYALLFVDLKIFDHYRRDHDRVKLEVMKLAQEANKYFYQINLRLIIVDILQTYRNDLSLYSFEDYRNKRLRELPFHNFAVLVSYRYAGGLAFVGGMCSSKSVMMSGFYPHNPEAMGSIFFHEAGHLIGVPHSHPNETLNVPNCACSRNNRDRQLLQPKQLHSVASNNNNDNKLMTNLSQQEVTPQSNGCLRIPGFDHDCTLQLMANLVYRNRCLSKEVRKSSKTAAIDGYATETDPKAEEIDEDEPKTIALCGNGVKEKGEQCDCGLEKYCRAWNCDPNTCTRPVPIWMVVLSAILITVASIAPIIAYFKLNKSYSASSLLNNRLMNSASTSFKRGPRKFISKSGLFFSSSSAFRHPHHHHSAPCSESLPSKKRAFKSPITLLLNALRYLKRKLCSRNDLNSNGSTPTRNRLQSSLRNERFARFSPPSLTTKNATLNPLSSIVIVHHHSPTFSSSSPSQGCTSPAGSNVATCSSAKLQRPKRPPPPPPSPRLTVGSPKQTHINHTLNNTTANTLTRPKRPPPPLPAALQKVGVGPGIREEDCREQRGVSTASKFSGLTGDEDRYSISHKFADFDDDEDYESDLDENLGLEGARRT